MGEFIPWYQDETGEWKMRDKQTYQSMMAWTEAEAVYYSDVLIPQMIGIERFESIINPDNNPAIISVARALQDMNISNEDARQYIIEIERDGTMPEAITTHPKYKQYRSVFIERMLRFHLLDAYQAGFEYDWWIKHQETAEVMLRFATTSNVPSEFVEGFETSIHLYRSYQEGFNPLRAEMAQILNIDIRVLALKMSYVLDSGVTTRAKELIKIELNTLERIFHEVRTAMTRVTDTSKSVSNLQAFVCMKRARKEVQDIQETFLQSDSPMLRGLSHDARTSLHDQVLPYFKPYEHISPSETNV